VWGRKATARTGNGKNRAKNEIQGSLRYGGKCAAFGRDDVVLGLVKRKNKQRQKQIPGFFAALRMTGLSGEAYQAMTGLLGLH
jgi:hypothetical protein